MVKDVLVDQAFSKANIINGSETVGSVSNGGNPLPNYTRILCNYPTIKSYCDEKEGAERIVFVISECQIITDEMFLENTTKPDGYLGTPNDLVLL